MRVADYIVKFLGKQNVDDVFLLTGAGMMFLSDAITLQDKVKAVCVHHEQSASMAAMTYGKMNGLGAAFFTTGCGATNGITGLLDAWQDNVPVMYFSGQVKRKETTHNATIPLRQIGVQEANIIPIVQSLTKYAVMVNEPESIRYHLEKALYLAKSGRPGPVWLDVPMDVQAAPIDEEKLEGFTPPSEPEGYKLDPTTEELESLEQLFKNAKRPVILAGHGVRLAGAIPELQAFIKKYQIPMVATFLSVDYLPATDPLFVGRIGIKGDRPGNFAIQNSDLVISIGCRLSVTQTSFEYDQFVRAGKVVVVDIDPNEHKKNTVRIDLAVNADAKRFLEKFTPTEKPDTKEWTEKCLHWKNTYPVCLPEYKTATEGVNLYYFMDRLSALMPDRAVIVSDAGSAVYVPSQASMLREGQRYITSGGQADMGFTMPGAIGIATADPTREVMAITGDGSFQLNLQELQTFLHYNFKIKLFVWNNDGYLSIRSSQTRFFEKRYIGTDSTSGVSFPSLEKLAHAYGIPYVKIEGSAVLDEGIKKTLAIEGPVLCEVMCIRDQEIVPAVSSKKLADGRMVSKPMEDLYPFLDREVFKKEMIIEPIAEE